LLIPEKLYGREREIDALLAAFDRVIAHGTAELVLVSGYSGVGKSSVVNELHKALVPPRGLFASGKFDQYKRDIPYATLAQAFQTLVRQILAKSEPEVAQWRGALHDALGPNGQLIVNLIPELEFVIGKQPPVPDLTPQDAQNRFQMVFRRFLGVFAHEEHPLALFLDDLQWLDAATLDLLEHLVTHSEVPPATGRGLPGQRGHSIPHAYANDGGYPQGGGDGAGDCAGAARSRRCRSTRGRLAALQSGFCGSSGAAGARENWRQSILRNPIPHGAGRGRAAVLDTGAAAWTSDLARIRAKGYTDNIVDFMVAKLKRLSDTTQQGLKQLACLGNVAEIATLTLVSGISEEEIHTAL
jgi:predicted ATPase